MSVHVYVRLRDGDNAPNANALLGYFEPALEATRFIEARDNWDWLQDINNNPKSPQRHLKPEGRDLRIDELEALLPAFTEVGLAHLDIGYNRTSKKAMVAWLRFINENQSILREVDGISNLIDRSGSGEQFGHLAYLDTTLGEACYKLPAGRQDPEFVEPTFSGTLRYWGNSRVATLLANVEAPAFMKRRQHLDPQADGLQRTRDGKGILLIPLLTAGEEASALMSVHRKAAQIGVCEPFWVFAAKAYHMALPCDALTHGELTSEDARELIEWSRQCVMQAAGEAGISGQFAVTASGAMPSVYRKTRLTVQDDAVQSLPVSKKALLSWIAVAAWILAEREGVRLPEINAMLQFPELASKAA